MVTINSLSRSARIYTLLASALVCFIGVFAMAPIAQDLGYHNFADQRMYGVIPNFGDVAGNGAFIIVGLLGLLTLIKRCRLFSNIGELFLWVVFFTGVLMVSFGSAYYHLSPSNASLVWDRLPMTIAFMSLFSIVLMERVDKRAGLMLFPLFLAYGIFSIWYWNYTESMEMGDLRPYVLVQFFPMVAIGLILVLFPAAGGMCFVFTLAFYMLAKVLEYFDPQIFALTGEMISGHTLKHVAAAIAVLGLVRYIEITHPTPAKTA